MARKKKEDDYEKLQQEYRNLLTPTQRELVCRLDDLVVDDGERASRGRVEYTMLRVISTHGPIAVSIHVPNDATARALLEAMKPEVRPGLPPKNPK